MRATLETIRLIRRNPNLRWSFIAIRILVEDEKELERYNVQADEAQHFVLTDDMSSIYWAPATF